MKYTIAVGSALDGGITLYGLYDCVSAAIDDAEEYFKTWEVIPICEIKK